MTIIVIIIIEYITIIIMIIIEYITIIITTTIKFNSSSPIILSFLILSIST